MKKIPPELLSCWEYFYKKKEMDGAKDIIRAVLIKANEKYTRIKYDFSLLEQHRLLDEKKQITMLRKIRKRLSKLIEELCQLRNFVHCIHSQNYRIDRLNDAIVIAEDFERKLLVYINVVQADMKLLYFGLVEDTSYCPPFSHNAYFSYYLN